MGKGRLAILGAGESGVGAAILGKEKGYEVFVSDFGQIGEKYKNVLLQHEIEWEEGGHTEARLLTAGLCVKSPGIPDTAPVVVAMQGGGDFRNLRNRIRELVYLGPAYRHYRKQRQDHHGHAHLPPLERRGFGCGSGGEYRGQFCLKGHPGAPGVLRTRGQQLPTRWDSGFSPAYFNDHQYHPGSPGSVWVSDGIVYPIQTAGF